MAINGNDIRTATAYEALGIDPCAPIDLISASYWNLVKELQVYRNDDPRVDTMLYHAMRAYETLSDPDVRKEYDGSIGMDKLPLTKRKFQRAKNSRLGFLPGRNKLQITADPYEVMGLHPTTLQSSVPDAYRIMRQQYLRLNPGSKRRIHLLDLLDTSYAVLNDPEKRAIYDEALAAKTQAAAPDEAEAAAEPTFEPILIEDEAVEEPEAVAAVAVEEDDLELIVEPPSEDGATPETEPAVAETADMMQTRYVVKDAAVTAEPEVVEPEVAEPEVAEPDPDPVAPPIVKVPDPAPSRAGRLRRTTKVAPVAMDDDLVPPPPRRKRSGPRRATVEGDVEALLIGRLEARMSELAAFGGSSEPPE